MATSPHLATLLTMSDNFRTTRSTESSDSDDNIQSEDIDSGETFKTPEAIDKEQQVDEHIDLAEENMNKKPGSKKHRKSRLPKLSRKQWLIVAGVVLFLLASFLTYWIGFHRTHKPEEPGKKTVYVAPTTGPSPLTGVEVSLDLVKMPVTGIMIENSPDARPQSGLKDAGVVYEAIAEGGITRFLALYQEAQPDYIGPVRSARPYYVDWVLGYDAGYAHVGGSPDALAAIKSLGVKDLDQFSNPGAYQRISSRYAPHNVYTSRAALRTLEQSKGYNSSTFTGFERKKETAVTAVPTARVIDITLSGFLYNTHYDYDQTSNTYKRVMAGKPHVDERSGVQLSPKNLVALVLPYSIASDGIHSIYGTVGSGKAIYFLDGTRVEGTWEKKGSKDPLILKDAAGANMKLNPGQTWITAIKSPAEATSGP